MDIISPPRFGSRKRSWGDEQLDRPFKRATYSRTRDRPQCLAFTQQTYNFPFEVNIQPEDEIMASANEPSQDQIQGLPPRHTLQPITTLPATSINIPPSPSTTASSFIISSAPQTVPISAAPANVHSTQNIKRRFAIGPRSNCERCLSGEPGHYGHWL
ncbi:hypothetical protein FRC12_013195 [Ceratobasidium sp. 428]|nr:hypothetical protein FRC12_013195 [Ceratobasidium sp. 428]